MTQLETSKFIMAVSQPAEHCQNFYNEDSRLTSSTMYIQSSRVSLLQLLNRCHNLSDVLQ